MPPTKFRPDRHPMIIQALASVGKNRDEIAALMEISRDTLYSWQKRWPEVKAALEHGAVEANAEIVASLFKRATGYEYEETRTAIIKRPDGTQETRVEKVKKFVAPDTTALIFWLKNRLPDQFKDVNDMRHSGAVKVEHEEDSEIKELLKNNPEAKAAVRAAFDALYPGPYAIKGGANDARKAI